MFNAKNVSLTLMLFVLSFCGSYVYYGLIYILPTVLQEFHKDTTQKEDPSHFFFQLRYKPRDMLTAEQYDLILFDIVMTCCFEIPSDISNGFTPNIKWIGRKGAIIIGFFFTVLFTFLCIIHPSFMTVYACFLRFFINISYNVIYIYSTEAYPTYMRSTGIGLSTFFSRFGGFSTPFISDALFLLKPIYPFLGFFIASTIGLITALSLPFDTLDRITY